jgi:hypothetical protein
MWAVTNFGVRGPGFAFVIIFPLDLWNCSDSVLFFAFLWHMKAHSNPLALENTGAFKPFGA